MTALLTLLLAAACAQTPPAIVRLEARGAIDPPTAAYLSENIARAEAGGAQAVLIELDTPGGLLDATRDIIRAMINSPLPVILYVSPPGARATSAGLFLMMAADAAAMAPDTHLGAAHPVSLGGGAPTPERDARGKDAKKPAPDAMSEKAVSDAAAYVRALAKERGRDAAWAERAVRESVSLTASEALARGVIEILAEDRDRLLSRLDGRRIVKRGRATVLRTKGAPVTFVEMTAFQKVLHTLANPNLAYLFLMIGIYGLIYEFSSPGVGLGAIVGLTSLVLAGYSLSILPVNWAGVILVGLGVLLLALETQIVSHGLLAVGGLTLLALGSLFLFDSPGPLWRVSRPLIAGTVGVTAAFFLLVVAKALEARRAPAAVGVSALVGKIGVAQEPLAPSGLVLVNGELWTAQSDRPVAAGEKVVVRAADGRALKVDKA